MNFGLASMLFGIQDSEIRIEDSRSFATNLLALGVVRSRIECLVAAVAARQVKSIESSWTSVHNNEDTYTRHRIPDDSCHDSILGDAVKVVRRYS